MPDPSPALIRATQPCAVVIFGASGDLTRRKLLPALWNLHSENRLPDGFSVVGVGRTLKSDAEFRAEARRSATAHSRFRVIREADWENFAASLTYQQIHYDDPRGYHQLESHLQKLCDERGSCGNQLFYLATPPSGYEEITRQLGACGLAAKGAEGGWSRIVVEKPFGSDLPSARRLNEVLRGVFLEQQIYRIDHYLGKETVQNLLVFRFANGIIEPIWNRQYIDHVQISVAEQLGVEGRGAYYEESGAMRDMIQNHLMQVLCLVAMEAPVHMDDRSVRNEKSKVLEAIRPISYEEAPSWTARGQYTSGTVGGESVPGYVEEHDVNPNSRTETYAAVKFLIDNWRWAGVPFYLRSGKRLPRRVTEVSIHFRRAPHLLFRDFGEAHLERNVLTIRVQPNEGIMLRFGVKIPGAGMRIRPVAMDFDYGSEFHAEPPEAYERLLLDCMLGDITLFSRDDWMELSWGLIDPILRSWRDSTTPLPVYPAGTWGPAEADELLQRDARSWWTPG